MINVLNSHGSGTENINATFFLLKNCNFRSTASNVGHDLVLGTHIRLV